MRQQADESRLIQIHSAAAEQLMKDPRWKRSWVLDKIMAETGVHWEVMEGRRRVASGITDTSAILQALETSDGS